jgi:hypothetical protein
MEIENQRAQKKIICILEIKYLRNLCKYVYN